jgi:hypothetical protein
MAMEGSTQEILGRLLASQERAEARLEKFDADAKARHEEAEARQEKMIAEMEARAEARHERFLARLDGLTFYGEGTTTWQTTSSSEEMEATNLEATSEETEAAVERQDLFKEETNFQNIGSSEDRCKDQRQVVRRR